MSSYHNLEVSLTYQVVVIKWNRIGQIPVELYRGWIWFQIMLYIFSIKALKSTLDLLWLQSQLSFGSFFPQMYHHKMVFFQVRFYRLFSPVALGWITFPFLVTKVLDGIHCLEVATGNRKITVYSVTLGYPWKYFYTLQSYWDFQWTVTLFINYRRKSGQEMDCSPRDYYIPVTARLC